MDRVIFSAALVSASPESGPKGGAGRAVPMHQLLNIGVVGVVLFIVAKVAFDWVERRKR